MALMLWLPFEVLPSVVLLVLVTRMHFEGKISTNKVGSGEYTLPLCH